LSGGCAAGTPNAQRPTPNAEFKGGIAVSFRCTTALVFEAWDWLFPGAWGLEFDVLAANAAFRPFPNLTSLLLFAGE